MHHRRLSLVSIASSWSSHSEDEKHTDELEIPSFERSRQASTCSDRSCEGMSVDETRELWRCMLELQGRYGCYNSTRIDLAMDAGEEGIDLMREWIIKYWDWEQNNN